MFKLWARNIKTCRYEFIKTIAYDNRFYEIDQLDSTTYYEAMVIDENNNCVFYVELDRPLIKRLKRG